MEKKKILLTDGVELIRGLEKAFFRRNRYHLLVNHDGRQVLDTVARERPDLIFLDLDLSGMNGDDCCRRLKDDPNLCAIPVVLVTTEQEAEVERCRRAACDEIIFKPISRHQLSNLTRRILEIAARTLPRYETRLRILFGPDPQNLFIGHTLNLGTGGALIETSYPFPVDSLLVLEVFLPGAAAPLNCSGRVAWVNSYPDWMAPPRLPHEMGVQFVDLASPDKDTIRAYLEGEGLNPSL